MILVALLLAVIFLAGCGTSVVGEYRCRDSGLVLNDSGNYRYTMRLIEDELEKYGTYGVLGGYVLLYNTKPEQGDFARFKIEGHNLRDEDNKLYLKQ